MAQAEPFYRVEIDRTPYASCAYLAIFVVAVFLLGATLLWDLATYVKQHHWFSFAQPAVPTFSSNLSQEVDQAVNQQKQKATDNLQQAAQSAQDAAAAAAQKEVDKQVQTQKEKLQTQGQQQLQNYLAQ